jgi:hypothetical protein
MKGSSMHDHDIPKKKILSMTQNRNNAAKAKGKGTTTTTKTTDKELPWYVICQITAAS